VEADVLIGRRIAAARNDAKLSQRSLATALGVSVRTVQNYESGRIVPYRHLDTLSRLLRRRTTWLLSGEEEPDLDRLLTELRRQRQALLKNTSRLLELGEELSRQLDGAHSLTEQ
jgi:transcriptional regulator with XRE-family HTH domain